MDKRFPILIGVVTAAILLGLTAGIGSAKQPAPPVRPVPPLSNACLKVGDTFQSAFSLPLGKPVSGTCITTKPGGFNADDAERLTRGCKQAADNFGAVRFFADPSIGTPTWTCSLFY